MTFSDLAWISVGQFTLAFGFGLGILVGISLQKRKDSHGYGNQGTEEEQSGRHHV
jgi:hypothetical protein